MSSPQSVRAVILVSGRVQGVGYRTFAHAEACRRGVTGGVRNRPDGRVEVQVEGERSAVETFIEALRRGPRLARVDDLHIDWASPTQQTVGFDIWY